MRPTRSWVKRTAAAGAAAALTMLIVALALDRLFPPDLTRLADRSTLVVDSDGRLLTPFTARDGSWRLPVAVDQVDARYLHMLVAYEDKRFDSHWGVDPLALMRRAPPAFTRRATQMILARATSLDRFSRGGVASTAAVSTRGRTFRGALRRHGDGPAR